MRDYPVLIQTECLLPTTIDQSKMFTQDSPCKILDMARLEIHHFKGWKSYVKNPRRRDTVKHAKKPETFKWVYPFWVGALCLES